MKAARLAARLILAAVFLYAGVVKLGTSERFAITMAQFFILPQAWIGPIAATLPWLEILVAITLLVPASSRIGGFLAAALLIAFIAALSWAWAQGFTVDCGCFGGTEDEPANGNPVPFALARDLVLLLLTLPVAARFQPGRRPELRSQQS